MTDKNILGQTAYFPLLFLLDDELNKRKDALTGIDTSPFGPASLAVTPDWQKVAAEGAPETHRSVLRRLLENPASLSYNDFVRYVNVWQEVYRKWIEDALQAQNRLVGGLGDISLLGVQQAVKEELNRDVNYYEIEKQLLDQLYQYVTTLERANKESDRDKKSRLYQRATALAQQIQRLEDGLKGFASAVGKTKLTDASSPLKARAIAGASALALLSQAIREGASLNYTHYTDVPGAHLWRQASSTAPIDPLGAHRAAWGFWNRMAELVRTTGRITLGLSAIEPLLRNKTLTMAFNKSDGRWYLFPARWIQKGVGKDARYEVLPGSRAVGVVLPIRVGKEQEWVVQLFGDSPDVYESIADLYDVADILSHLAIAGQSCQLYSKRGWGEKELKGRQTTLCGLILSSGPPSGREWFHGLLRLAALLGCHMSLNCTLCRGWGRWWVPPLALLGRAFCLVGCC
jgi:hypothetical protein